MSLAKADGTKTSNEEIVDEQFDQCFFSTSFPSKIFYKANTFADSSAVLEGLFRLRMIRRSTPASQPAATTKAALRLFNLVSGLPTLASLLV